ncbi:putative non-LTR retroelement reverse transcriptase [Sesbania bispinosa]|nr:putative non-LTR retroelement reverse transcriptase [Sesbania bispinosa]
MDSTKLYITWDDVPCSFMGSSVPWQQDLLDFALKAYMTKGNGSLPTPRLVTWISPPEGAVAINTVGISQGNPGLAGLLRDHTGKLLSGFLGSAGVAEILLVELAISHGDSVHA